MNKYHRAQITQNSNINRMNTQIMNISTFNLAFPNLSPIFSAQNKKWKPTHNRMNKSHGARILGNLNISNMNTQNMNISTFNLAFPNFNSIFSAQK